MTSTSANLRPLCIGHRGAAHDAPENTIPGYRRGLDSGADVIEVDVYRTADGHIICIHDRTYDRTTNGSGPISGLPLEQVKALDAGSWKGDEFAGTTVPTLREALDCICPEAMCAIEIKQEGIVDDVVRVVHEANASERALIISFDDAAIARAHEIAPEVATGLIVGGEVEGDPRAHALSLIARCRRAGGNFLSVAFPLVTPELIRECQLHGVSLWAWTLNAEPPMRALTRAGLAGVTSDRPDLLRRVIDEEVPPPQESR